MFLNRKYSWITALAAGTICTLIPLIRDFHIESAVLAATTGAFWAGFTLAGQKDFSISDDLRASLRILLHLYIFGLPLFILSLFMGCINFHGTGFWILFPIPSVFLAAGVARIVRSYYISYPRFITLAIIVFIAVGEWLIEFYMLPQVFFHNHIWGGWPGPIYDETVSLTFANVFFRSLTVAWGIILWLIPVYYRNKKYLGLLLCSLAYLLFGYSHLADFGVISPNRFLQQQLRGAVSTPHFNIYYDQDTYTQYDIKKQALLHEFYLHQITNELDISTDYSQNKIESYLYAHPWQKKELTGAKYTSYVPVWLKQDQIHIAKPQLQTSLKHEMVHVIAKQFGNRLINASWNIGLVEGLAVALSGNHNTTSTIDQLAATKKKDLAIPDLKRALSFSGFYTGRSAVNYTTMGSFIRFLLENYHIDYFKRAYQTGYIGNIYPVPIDTLITQWKLSLETIHTDSLDQQAASQLFSRLSVFEKSCPHNIDPVYYEWDRWLFHKAENNIPMALHHIRRAKEMTKHAGIWRNWAQFELYTQNADRVIQEVAPDSLDDEFKLLKADAHFLEGNEQKALTLLGEVDSGPLPSEIRTDNNNRKWYLNITYKDSLPHRESFKNLSRELKHAALAKSMEIQDWDLFVSYSNTLSQEPLNTISFQIYFRMIEWLIVNNYYALAEKWMQKIAAMTKRTVHKASLRQLNTLFKFAEIHPVTVL